jgi:hypothetical protein
MRDRRWKVTIGEGRVKGKRERRKEERISIGVFL